ncbi:hypothetical protein DYH56_10870 [Psychrilyobacter piezotolerans]|uniref:Uncharacterized protein n=1 Tax=Psychrilyobacter piezotolerans TaxID=2293438 RepID=A0ABX9KG00_9FUSO|nr:hypothetical protein DV867_10870 [Psychrilyobacter sp. S5]REI40510.1 hypothetical protein DYH56_10870 [Psychrilyobacter piezotolerans]
MKVSRTVWMRGKDGDNFKVLPIHIKGKGLEFRVNPWKYKTNLFEFRVCRKADSIWELFWKYKK